MKSLFKKFSIILFIGVLLACSPDDPDEGPKNKALADEQNELEERLLPIAEIESGILINGVVKKTGTPPAPNSQLNLSIDASAEGFINAGFEMKFVSTSDDIAGAYVQFKEINGSAASDYYDIPQSAFSSANRSTDVKNKINSRKMNVVKKTVAQNLFTVDVNFNQSVKPGKFCYDICIYDSNNNISQIKKVCVEIEAWGGNADIVGEWLFDRREPSDNQQATINCDNGDTFDADYEIYDKDEWTLVLNEDGSYYELYYEISQPINYSESVKSCKAVYNSKKESKEKFSGNWAFNETDKTLTVIDFKYENLLNSSENLTYPYGGELYFEGVEAYVISNELVLSETYDGNGNGQTETYKVIFKRK